MSSNSRAHTDDRGGAATRHRILDAAWNLIRRRGLEIAMKDIASAVGISRQALYLHFPSRAHLLRAMTLHHDIESQVRDRLVDALDAPTAVEALEAVIRVWFVYVEEILPVARALHAAAPTDEHASLAWWEANDRALSIIRLAVERLHRDGRLDASWEIDEAAEYLWSLTHVRSWDDLVGHFGWPPDRFVERQVHVAKRVLLA